ncbi:FAR1-related sequence 5-like protein [Tanacetum coccineum]
MRTPRPTLYEQNETPGGSIYWEPHVEGIPIPVEGTYYGTIDEALDMYTKYAEMAGFEVKKGGQRKTKSGAVQHKYIYCNKEGVPKGININTLDPEYNKQKRNTTTHATGCKAHIRLVLDSVSGKYKLESFKPKHNHMLIPKEYKHFTKKQRKMNQSEKMFVVKAATNKIGATRAHNLYCSMKGGYEYVHGTSDDFKNHQRDVNQFIGESDAQMLINKMENRKNYVPNFTFQYKVDNSELVAMFWADEVAKCNYKEFGDIVSFDATFNSNKDSSGISCDSTESHQISLVIPFESYEISLESHVILVESQEILLESHVILLESHVILLLMRTTSRSESENSFFKSFTSPGATLVSFMMSYESAMERQRYRQESLDFKTIDATPKCITQLDIELHAARVYTMTMFLIVQTEINEGCWNCTIQGLNIDEGKSLFHKKKEKREKNKRRKLEQWEKQRKTISKDEGKMGTYVENLKKLLDEVKADMPNPPSRDTGDVIGGIFSITKPDQIGVQNPTKAVNKGEHLKKGERLKSEREKALTVAKKKVRPCGFCEEMTNEHTKTTCPLNPKARKKRKATPVIVDA